MNKKAGIQSLIIGFLLVALFVFAFVQFGINLSEKNGANQSIGDVPGVLPLQTSIFDNSSGTAKQAEDMKNKMSKEFGVLDGVLMFPGAVSLLFQIMVAIFILPISLTEFVLSTFGGLTNNNSSKIAGMLWMVIYTMSAIVISLGLWRFFKTGD